MRDAIADYPNASNFKVDFYDRERIAGWVRSHPSLVLWVRDKIGQPLHGWKPYGNWAGSPRGVEEQYILDEPIRIYNNSISQSDGLSTVNGLNEIRGILHHPRSSVRLIGLSGVGKTRFVQALFDERIGEKPLNQFQVFYTDFSDDSIPDPRNFAERIIAQKIPAILVIDNCGPELHKRLTSVCSAPGSLVSIITVEYDVRDDYPEATDVYRLEPASSELIEKIISSRFSHVSQVDIHTIANFAGGNARIAIALANTIRRGENLGNLRDNELFRRLFQQRNVENENLIRTAEVCSLVYSFDFQTAEGLNAELKLLGSLVSLSVQEIYQNVRKLQRRDLVQQRGIWRAVLPHAIANRLAGSALENIPLQYILDIFEHAGCPRILRSFSRRLSFLHESDEAVEISRKWLREDGLLGDVSNLNELGISMLLNIAPINPDLTLTALERVVNKETFFSRENEHFNDISRLLRSLAYDKDYFVRSVNLLSLIALSEDVKENNNSIRSMIKSLFYLYLSGTHASSVQRLSVISNLIESNDEEKIGLAFLLLSSALESWHFSSSYGFEFGAHSRDYGYSPSNTEDIKKWYKLFIEYTASLAISDYIFADMAKSLLAEKFRGLWVNVGMYNELEVVAKKIGTESSWREGYLAVKSTIRFDSEKMDPDVLSRLNGIGKNVEPKTLIEKAKLYTLSNHRSAFDLTDIEEFYDEEEGMNDFRKVDKITHSLGKEVGSNEEVYKELLPELLSNEGARLIEFGEGLVEGFSNPEELWRDLLEHLSLIDDGVRNFQLLRGVLRGTSKIDRNLAEMFLDKAVTDQLLAKVYPWLQTSIEISSQGVERLKRALEVGISPIWQYGNLAYGRVHETIDDNDLCELLRIISSKPDGHSVAIDILNMRLHGLSDSHKPSDIIVLTGQHLVLNYQFTRKGLRVDLMDYELSKIIRACFVGNSAKENARTISDKLYKAIESYQIIPRNYDGVLKALASLQPLAFIESFLEKENLDDRIERVFLEEVNPLIEIENDTIISWCEENPKARYPIVASAIIPYQKNESTGRLEWTPLAQIIVSNAYNPIEILDRFKASFRPWSWSGSKANLMQQKLILISNLKES